MKVLVPTVDVLEDWKNFCQKHFGIRINLSGLRIPKHQHGFDRVIVVPRGLTIKQVFQACRDNFSCMNYYDDLDKAVTKNNRDNKKRSYAVRVKNRAEANNRVDSLLVSGLAKMTKIGVSGITFLERLLLEIKNFDETGKHLSSDSSICPGSRISNGAVPNCCWNNCQGEFHVRWCYPIDPYQTSLVVIG